MKRKWILLSVTAALAIIFLFEIYLFLELEKEYSFISGRNRLSSEVKPLTICLSQYLNGKEIDKSVDDIISCDSSLELKKVFDDGKLIILKSRRIDGYHFSFDLLIGLDFNSPDSPRYLIAAHDYTNGAFMIFQEDLPASNMFETIKNMIGAPETDSKDTGTAPRL